MSQRVLLLFSRDPGSTNRMIAVDWLAQTPTARVHCQLAAHLLFGQTDEVIKTHIFAEQFGVKNWQKNNINPAALPTSTGAIEKLLIDQGVTHVITGLDDIDARTSRLLWQVARSQNIPVYLICDNDENLVMRLFSLEEKPFWPDLILTRHDDGDKELLEAGCPPDIIQQVPDLYHLYFQDMAKKSHQDLRDLWQCSQDDQVILFISENAQEMAAHGRPAPFNEYDELDKLLSWLQNGQLPDGTKLQNPILIIRPHPREAEGKFDAYLNQGNIRLFISQDGAPKDAIQSCDYVVGMKSAFLNEAALLHKPVLSLLDYDKKVMP